MENNYPIIIAALVLCLFLLYKEMNRLNKDRLLFRSLAILIAVTALVLLFIPLKYKEAGTSKADEMVILTRGAELQQLKGADYFTTDSNVLGRYGAKRVQYLADLSYYLRLHPETKRISVYGYGLQPEELKRLKNITFDFYPPSSPAGIISSSWSPVLKQTAFLEVQGMYNNTGDQPVKLFLEGLGSNLDSLSIAEHTKAGFFLKSRPKQLGAAVYKLYAVKGRDTIAHERVPFRVVESPKIKILVLSSWPDFEYKFLKNWLFENKYPVVFRTRISKDKFSVDQLNSTAVNAEEVNAGMLNKFDLIIADDDELSKMSKPAISSLHAAIDQGLGMLVRINDVKPLSAFGQQYKFYAATDSGAKSFKPVFIQETGNLRPIPSSPLIYIKPQVGEQPLVNDEHAKTLLSTSLYGNGKIVVSTITSTYNWILSGGADDYAEFWANIIGHTSRKEAGRINWATIPAFPVINNEVSIIVETSTADSVPVIAAEKTKLSPLQHNEFPFRWEATWWPQQIGWNELKTDKNRADSLFVYAADDWVALKNQSVLENNLSFAENTSKKVTNKRVDLLIVEKEVSKWWFFLLFMISAGYIWFETKLL